MPAYVWLLVMIVMIVVEASTVALTSIWFAGGALAAYLTALLTDNLTVQVAVFAAVSVLLLIYTRPFAQKVLKIGRTRTNVNAMAGRRAIVTEEINNLCAAGQVTVDGMPWTARTEKDGEILSVGTEVEVMKVSGVKLIVRPVSNS